MFYVDKNTLPRYWCAYTGTIRETVGTNCGNESDFDNELDAVEYAKRLLLARLTDDYNRANRYSRLVLTIYAIRAIWNSKLRKALASYYKKRAEAHDTMLNPPAVGIKYVPTMIPVEGDKLEIGTKVYCIDVHNLTITENTVIEEHIYYYDFKPEGSEASYRIGPSAYVTSNLTSQYSTEIYLDKEEATKRIIKLWQDKIEALEKQIKSL